MIRRKRYAAPPIQRQECLRYAGCRQDAAAEEKRLLEECLQEIDGRLTYQVCWERFPIRWTEGGLDLGFVKTDSAGLSKNLEGAEEILLFAATIGLEMDRAIRRYTNLSPAKALFFQAIGAERIESLCDAFCEEQAAALQAEGKFLKPRFSPGYGDLPLTLQKDIFRVLDCPRQIGLTLNESLLMSPSKSVTAIVGITKEERMEEKKKPCGVCQKKDCVFRG